MELSKSVQKYLASFAEEEAQLCFTSLKEALPEQPVFHHVLVVPAYKETVDFVQRFKERNAVTEDVLFITVINQPERCTNSSEQKSLYRDCKQLGAVVFEDERFCLLDFDEKSMLLLVNRFDFPIADEKGVGLARKIGADIAIKFIAEQWIKDRWVYSSDADAHLPNNYFKSLRQLPPTSIAACFDFYHRSSDQQVHLANQQYESALRYYVAGLQFAQSTYAFFTIGSTLAFDYQAYCMARGFPTRAAGEDFYLLNKVAKLGEVAFIDAVQIKIDARTSDRVPFGTGPAVNKILSDQQENREYYYYHPQVFVELKECINHCLHVFEFKDNIEAWLSTLSIESQMALQQLGFIGFVQKQRHNKQQQFDKQLRIWFDAFKTLKFIHYIRDSKYPDIPLKDALASAPFNVAHLTGESNDL